ncbi:CHAT domain-containing protein [Herbihabitans rhizosphaerae]|uniref:CHAT domain-containing protein n=1 Tax=Herbihabitans rhizosphaerae TaxID=1872711 RepID=A0A4Q7KWL3_9PSEU|nr:CHAT domain-containing protein [Herbihabitans rhizosphaerae]RZS41085.1 CHAT domain-containing protein [Herbihabitans rhizosphaerae]
MTAGGVELARALHQQAVVTASGADPAEAARLLRRALRELPEIDSVDTELVSLRTKVLATLALAETETGSIAGGLVHLDTAESLLAELPRNPGRAALQGLVTGQRGIVLLRGGRTDDAVAHFDAAIPLLERGLAAGAGDPAVLARTLMNRALAHLAAGRPAPARRDLQRCIAQAVDGVPPIVPAKARHNLGDLAQLVGDVPGALRHYELAGDAYAALAPGMLPRLRLDQGRALLAAGLADEAARHLDEAMDSLRDKRIGQDLAEAEVSRAAAAILAGDLAGAVRLAGSARQRFLRRGNLAWAEVAALTRMRARAVQALTGQAAGRRVGPEPARELADRLSALGLVDEALLARMMAVRLALRRGSATAAEELLADVRPPRRTAPMDHQMLYRLCHAELAVAHGETRKALAQARTGLAELERVRDRMGGLDLVCGTAVHGRALGRLAVGIVLEGARGAADARRLLAWQERTRAQVYRYEPLPVIDDPLLADRVAEVRTLLRAIQVARLEGRSSAALERRCETLQREVSRLGWRTSRWGRPRPMRSPEEIADALGDRTLVSFSGPGKELAAVVVHSGRTSLVRLGAVADAAEIARQLHADLDVLAPDHLPARLAASVQASARKRAETLDELLFRPLAGALGGGELVLVPHGPLYPVPWAALPSLRGRPVSVAPSASTWTDAASRHRASDGPTVLVTGPHLPESSDLRSIYPDAVVLKENRAAAGAVLAAMDGARLVHVDAHGTHVRANAMFSRLELADGPLLAHETSHVDSPPEHVVLAACELALAHIRPGDEALGFAGALLVGGSRTVVAAVTRVGHRAAAATMYDYHRRLAAGATPAAALAAAVAVDPLRRPFICLGAG